MIKTGRYDFLAQDSVLFGTPCVAAVMQTVEELGVSRVFLVSSQSLSRETDVVSSIIDLLRAAYLRVLMYVNKRSISTFVSVFACAMVLSPKSFVCVNCIVFSYIYLDNLSPAEVAGYRARAWRNELAVDNFLAVFFFNFFNVQTSEYMKT